jgi:hypothetical protein
VIYRQTDFTDFFYRVCLSGLQISLFLLELLLEDIKFTLELTSKVLVLFDDRVLLLDGLRVLHPSLEILVQTCDSNTLGNNHTRLFLELFSGLEPVKNVESSGFLGVEGHRVGEGNNHQRDQENAPENDQDCDESTEVRLGTEITETDYTGVRRVR